MKKYYDIDGYQSSPPSQYLPPQGREIDGLIALSEWAIDLQRQTLDLQRQLIKKDEAIRELVEGLKETVRCCGVFKDNMIDVDVTLEEHCNQIKNAQSLIQKHKQ